MRKGVLPRTPSNVPSKPLQPTEAGRFLVLFLKEMFIFRSVIPTGALERGVEESAATDSGGEADFSTAPLTLML
jgi:hypothetical protein